MANIRDNADADVTGRRELRGAGRTPPTFATRAVALLVVAAGFVVPASSACVSVDLSPGESRAEYALTVPPVLQPTSSDASGDHYTIVQKQALQPVAPTFPASKIEGYEGMWPGPTIVARRDRPTFIKQVNQLEHPVVVHNHGLMVAPEHDGHPADFVPPGAAREYVYPNRQPAGTFWYHDHQMDRTGANVWKGLAGLYVIKDDQWDSLRLPTGNYDVPLIIQDRSLKGDGEFYIPLPPFGDVTCVNGKRTPRMQVANRRYLFRMLNGSDHRVYQVIFQRVDNERGVDVEYLPFTVVASDGGLLPRSVVKQHQVIAPAERYGVVFDFSRFPVGTSIIMRNIFQVGQPQVNLPEVMRFDIVREEPDDSAEPPAELAPMERLDPNAPGVVHRVVEFGRADSRLPGEAEWQINGKNFDPARIDFRGKLGQTEVWDVINSTNAPHVLHVHLVQFQVLEREGAAPAPEQMGWKDSIFTPPGTNAKIILKWEGFKGVYVFHCHLLGHEDKAMMAQVEVTD